MAQAAEIVSRWASELQQAETTSGEIDFAAESAWWRGIANEFIARTRLMWRDNWFRDYDSVAQEWSEQQDTMHLAPIFCGATSQEHIESLLPSFVRPPVHSGWAPLSWPPVAISLRMQSTAFSESSIV